MSFTLASTEEDPIELHLTENAPIQLGRTFLNIHDTKVSRQQVEISLQDGKVVVKQLGINPSVVKKPDGNAWLLKKDDSATLEPNDHLLLIATATSDKHVEFKLTRKGGVKRRIQEEDEVDLADELPKKKYKVDDDLNKTIEDDKKKSDGEKSDSTFEKEIKELRSILPEISLEEIQTAILLAEGSVEMALQSLLDGKTKASEPVKDQPKAGEKSGQAKNSAEDATKDVMMVDEAVALTPPTSPLHHNGGDNKEAENDANKPAFGRTDSELALELQRQWEEEVRNAPQEYSNNEVKTAQQVIVEEVEKLKLVAGNCEFFYDELSFPHAFGVRMALDVKSIDKWKSKQLGINSEKDIIIQLKFTSEFTEDKDPPNFLIFQSNDKDLSALTLKDYETDFGAMQWFLETRLTKVLLKNWANKPVVPVKRNEDGEKSKENKEKVPEVKITEKKNAAKEAGVDENKLKQLTAMGFTEQKSIDALLKCKGNLDSATEMLLTGKVPAAEPDDSPAVKQLINMGFKRAEAVNALAAFKDDVKKAVASLLGEEIQDSQEEAPTSYTTSKYGGRGKKGKVTPRKGGRKTVKYVNDIENKELDEPEEEEEEDPIEALEYKSEQERLFADDAPFLVRLYNYMLYRFTTSPKYCMICDKEINLETGYKLPVCNKKSCNHVYNTSACGGNIINEIKTQPEVVELLLHLLCCAATGNNSRGFNRNGIGLAPKNNGYSYGFMGAAAVTKKAFEPFPHNIGFNYKDGTQNVDLLLEVLDTLPSIAEMKQCASDEQLKVILDDIHALCFPLLKWVIRSNRAHLSYVPKEKQIACMKTPYQFQLVNSFPEHEKKFVEWKEKAAILKAKRGLDDVNGSYWSFHGSPVENWHSIIRTGLRSGFVRGIYHAQQAIVSLGYMQVGAGNASGWRNGSWKKSKQISCISLIEVADFRHENDGKITGGTGRGAGYGPSGEDQVINVAMIDSLVVTRFLFFYPEGPTFQPPPMPYPVAGFGYGMGMPAFNPASLGPVANKLGVKDFMFIPQKEEKFEYPFGDYDYTKDE